MDPTPDEVVYRMGTPSSLGTISWAAAEQTVAQTPADLLTWRTVVSVDETHNPWVAWIDTNNVTSVGIVYIEASSTHDGTWTQNTDISSNWSVADPATNGTHAWFVNLCPIADTGDLMHLGWTSMETVTNTTGLYAVTFNVSSNTSDIQTVETDGGIYATRPDAFDFYDLNTDVFVVYTDDAGAVVGGSKNLTSDWADVYASFQFVKEDVGIAWIPTLSGYRVNATNTSSEDLLCIVHNEEVIYSGVNECGTNMSDWDWTLTWQTSDASDNLSRHNADYKYTSPVVFAWQVTDDSDTPDTDDVYLWWRDNSNDQFGYYSVGSTAGNTLLRLILPIAVAIGVVLAVLALWGADNAWKWVTAGLVGVVVFYAVLQLVNTLL